MSLEGVFVFQPDDVVRVDDGARKTMIAEAKSVRHLHQLARRSAVALRGEMGKENGSLVNVFAQMQTIPISNWWKRRVGSK